jgi:hypothetical protein
MFGRVFRITWIFVCATAFGSRSAEATQTIGPGRPLSHDEWIEKAVNFADGILIGHIESFNTIRTPVPGGLESEDQYLVVRPEQWLKGYSGRAPLRLMVGHSSELTQSEYDPREPYYFFMRKRIDRSTGRSEWRMNSSFDPVVRGMGRMTTALEGLPGEIANAIEKQTVRSLSRRADLIILGQPTGLRRPCQSYEGRGRCLQVRVISDIAGTAPDDTVCVFAWIMGAEPHREAIIFARRMSDGSFEILSSSAGSMEVDNGRVVRTGLPVAKQVTEIRDSLKIWKAH